MVLPFGISSNQHNPPTIRNDSRGGGDVAGVGVGGGIGVAIGPGVGIGVGAGAGDGPSTAGTGAGAATNDLITMMPAATALYPNQQGNFYIPSPYIDFIVVNGDDRYVVRCEKLAVLENSVELAKCVLLACSPTSLRKIDNPLKIFDVNNVDFELLIRFLETKTIKFNDHHHTLRILELANRFNCPDLIIHCVRELDLRLTSATVIDILCSIYFYHNYQLPAPRLEQHPTAPDLCTSRKTEIRKTKEEEKTVTEQPTNCRKNLNSTSTNPINRSSLTRKSTNSNSNAKTKHLLNDVNEQPFTAADYCVALLNNTLQLIDMHAELILLKPEIEDLRYEQLQMVVARDALMVTSEFTIYTCLANWSKAECKRKNLELTDENRRKVLGPLCYATRYGLMNMNELNRAMESVKLLNPAEISIITNVIEGRNPGNLTADQIQLLQKLSCSRPEFAKMPIHLSDRTNPKSYPKKMRSASTSDDCFDKYGLNCLSMVACLFD